MSINVWPVDAVSGAPEYSGRELRQSSLAPFAVLGDVARPLGGLSGVRSGTPISTVTATSTTWTCKPHAGILDLESAAEAGPYGYAVDANVTGSVTAANASNPRKDLIYAKLSDPAESDGSTAPKVEILYLAGTAAASPSAPATPARSLALAQISVPKTGGGSPSVTWVAPGVTPGEVQFQTKALLDLWTTAAPNQHATVINDSTTANNTEYYRNGSAWSPVVPAAFLSAFTFTGIYSSSVGAPVSVVNQGGRVYLEGSVASSSASFVAGTSYTLGSILTALAPAATQSFACTTNSTAVASVRVDSSGNVTMIVNTTFTGALNLAFGGCSWRAQ